MSSQYTLDAQQAAAWKDEVDALISEINTEFELTNQTTEELKDPNDPIIGTLADLGEAVCTAGQSFGQAAQKVSTGIASAINSILKQAQEWADALFNQAKNTGFR